MLKKRYNNKKEYTGSVIKITLILIGLILIGLFIRHNTKKLNQGPVVIIDTPVIGKTITEPAITVSGIALQAISLSINGRPLTLDPEGNFKTRLLVPPGKSILEVSATDRFSTVTKQKVELYASYAHTTLGTLSGQKVIPPEENYTEIIIELNEDELLDVPDP